MNQQPDNPIECQPHPMKPRSSKHIRMTGLVLPLCLLLSGCPDQRSGETATKPGDRLADGVVALGKARARPCPEGQPDSGGTCTGRRQSPTPATSSDRADAVYSEMVRLPGGTFMMGSDDADAAGEASERPRHPVTVAPFAIGKFEVTRDQYAAFVNATGHASGSGCATYADGDIDARDGVDWRNPGYTHSGAHPVVCVNLEDVGAYVTWLRGRTGRRFRLPTEAEWEYAARGGTESPQYWGDDPDLACEFENVADQSGLGDTPGSIDTAYPCADGAAQVAAVGSYRANPFGLFDMLGNVWEWTCSAYTEDYAAQYRTYEENDSHSLGYASFCTHDISADRAVRGGSWLNDKPNARAALRIRMDNAMRTNFLGFRLAED